MVKAWAAAMRLMSVLLCPFFAKYFGVFWDLLAEALDFS
jgi:hypothetical protein